jgi:glycosyltransferase involved in cell wall biosynthesis
MEIKLPKLQKIDPNIPKVKKKKILLLSDDFRLPSGIGTISKEIILNTVKEYDWIQLGAALKHPDHGKGVDVSADVAKETGIIDASVKVIPWTGYGDRNILFSIIHQEKPDAIFHFTDPRYWTWLYQLEHEIKTTYAIPIIYYSIWDDLPYPMWNAPFYGSCDMIMGISKQSDNIHREVLKQNNFEVVNYDNKKEKDQFKNSNSIVTGYVPHGLNHNVYKPLNKDDDSYKKMFKSIKEDNKVDFIFFWNNRNIRRKQPGDLILAFKTFVNKLPKQDRSRVALLMHTTVVDSNGTDLRAIHENIAPECKILFSQNKLSTPDLNAMYNIADVVVNIASNEGWGLSSTEALLSGTPIINNVTGGLQDQCGFLDEKGNWLQFNGEFSTNHKGTYKNHGRWVVPVFPSNRSVQGSPTTPYIFDDRVNFEDVSDAMMQWWETPANVREECGAAGRSFCLDNGLTAEKMGNKMIEMIDFLVKTPKQPKLRYTLNKVTKKQYKNLGII